MTTSPLSGFLREHVQEIVSEWERALRQSGRARGVGGPSLRDHVPELVERLAACAERASDPSCGDALATADVHGIQRLQQGFDVEWVVRELGVLREVIERAWLARSRNAAHELVPVHAAIDDVIARSVATWLQHREATTEALDRASAAAFESRDLDDLLHRLLRVMVDASASVETGAILLREGECLRVRAAIGLEAEVDAGFSLRIGEGFAGKIAAERRPVVLTSAFDDPLVRSSTIRSRGVRALFGVPLTAGLEVVGVAHIGSSKVSEFHLHERQLFVTIAARATSAIVHHLVRAEAERRAREASITSELGLAALGGLDVRELATRAVSAATELAGFEQVAFVRRHGDSVETLACAGDPRLLPFAERCALDLSTELRDSQPSMVELDGDRATIVPVGVERPADRFLVAVARSRRVSPNPQVLLAIANILATAEVRARADEAQRAIRQNDMRFRLALRSSGVMLFEHDEALRYRWVYNPPLHDVAEVLGRSDGEIWANPAEGAQLTALKRGVLERRAPAHAEISVTARGEQRHFAVDLEPIVDDGGRAVGIVGAATDVTESRETASTMRFLADATLALTETLEHGDVVSKLANLAVPRLADWCAVYLREGDSVRLAAVAHQDPAKVELARSLHGNVSTDADAGITHVLRTGVRELVPSIDEATLAATGRAAEWRAIVQALGLRSLLTVPLEVRGETVGALSLIMGESGRTFDEKSVEIAEELSRRAALAVENARLYRQANEAIRSRDTLLAIVSHDLKNPVAAIHAASTLLARTKPLGEEPIAIRQLGVVQRSVERMNRLINDLLDMASIEAGRLAIELRVEQAARLVHDAIELNEPIALEKGISLRANLAVDAAVRCDRQRILQVLSNLIGNAVKFSPENGEIDVLLDQDERGVRFAVRDRGPGIAASETSRVFDAFWSGQDGARRGTGLGLFISRGIVEAHGGRIAVSSAPGEGSTFELWLPLA